MTTWPSLSALYLFPEISSGIGAPSNEPIPMTLTMIPMSAAIFAASKALPSWSSPSVMMIIALPTLLSPEKELVPNLMASPIAVPWMGTISVSMVLRKSFADCVSPVSGICT